MALLFLLSCHLDLAFSGSQSLAASKTKIEQWNVKDTGRPTYSDAEHSASMSLAAVLS